MSLLTPPTARTHLGDDAVKSSCTGAGRWETRRLAGVGHLGQADRVAESPREFDGAAWDRRVSLAVVVVIGFGAVSWLARAVVDDLDGWVRVVYAVLGVVFAVIAVRVATRGRSAGSRGDGVDRGP
jgi:hypothetical protein